MRAGDHPHINGLLSPDPADIVGQHILLLLIDHNFVFILYAVQADLCCDPSLLIRPSKRIDLFGTCIFYF